ncbi:MAG: TraR/DksA family transcriptional regulator [Pseudonocardiaceae bacterium]
MMNVRWERERVRSRIGQCSDQLAEYLPNLREALERERDFRVEQLAELAADARRDAPCAQSPEADTEAAVREVAVMIAAGARQALAGIERALAAMRTGRYGCCETCAGTVPLAVLQAVPQTTLCLQCQRAPGHSDKAPVHPDEPPARRWAGARTERVVPRGHPLVRPGARRILSTSRPR